MSAAASVTAGGASDATCRWGVLGCAGIARKVGGAIQRSANGTVAAIGSRSLERSTAWAKEFGVPKAYGSYEEVLADPDIDAVYIPLPTAMHAEWAIKAAVAGKHVLCEKPVAANAGEVRDIVAACAAAGVQFMDGVMFMHHERLALMAHRIHEEKALGELRRVNTTFAFPSHLAPDFVSQDIRFKVDLEPLGCLGDLGWYNVRLALWAFKYELPFKVRATHWSFSPSGVIMEFDGVLTWADGRVASLDTAFNRAFRQFADLEGDHSRITLEDFCVAQPVEPQFVEVTRPGLVAPDFVSVVEPSSVTKVLHCCQELRMVETMSGIVLGAKSGAGAVNPFWPEVSLKTQVILDSLLESAGKGGVEVHVSPL